MSRKAAASPRSPHAAPSPQESEAEAQISEAPHAPAPFPIVGIGASAGGLEALEALLDGMPENAGFALVVVTHQAPNHISLLPELLARHTKLPVVHINDGMRVKPDHVYVSPGGKNLAIIGGALQPMVPSPSAALHMPIDYFFRSLAADQRERAICVVLSGTGTDGTLGLRAIKEQLGMAIVQAEDSAKFAGMPHSAAGTGLADYVLPPRRMLDQIVAYVRGARALPEGKFSDDEHSAAIRAIFVLIRNHTGHDFSGYKLSTMHRRIERRMHVHLLEQVREYALFLEANPHEIDLLFKELLISVTSFFRDKEALAALEHKLVHLLAERQEDVPLRIWVPACSTGEEAYSIGILLAEIALRSKLRLNVQIFGTDLDPAAVEHARFGAYPGGAAADLGAARLTRFFTVEDQVCRIKKEIRDLIVFAVQDVIKDPPFTKLDLISCRNLLIYLNGAVQKALLPVFHYALNANGLLLLGTSETTSGFDELFAPVDRKYKLYVRKQTAPGTTPPVRLPISSLGKVQQTSDPRHARASRSVPSGVEAALLERFAPPTVISNERGDIAYIHGRTGAYLEPNAGEPQSNLFAMAREGLRVALASTLRLAAKENREITRKRVAIETSAGGQPLMVDLLVQRILAPEAVRGLFRVSFERVQSAARLKPAPARDKRPHAHEEELELELKLAQETLQGTVEELQTSNEELKSSNEELQSMNEELQSANEELETSKEELQSLNEELHTVNAELQTKMEELSRANDDMQNLLNSTDVATLFLDRNLRIQRFTEQARQIISLIPGDIGRPIADLVSHVRYDKLAEDAARVLDTLTPHEVEVQTTQGEWRLVRFLPYRTAQNKVDGVVITFLDVDRVKKAELLAASRAFAESIVQAVREPLVVLDAQLRVLTANRAFLRMFAVSDLQLQGRLLFEIASDFFARPHLRELLCDVSDRGATFQDFEIDEDLLPTGGRRLRLNARRLAGELASTGYILLAIEDTTDSGVDGGGPPNVREP